jgi:hypothetical protein
MKRIYFLDPRDQEYKNRRGKSKTIVGEIPTIDFMLFLIFCPVKWAFEMRKGVKVDQ